MKRIYSFIYALLCVFTVWAAPRAQEQAAAIARDFLAAPSSVVTRTAARVSLAATSADLLDTPAKRSGDAQPAFYVYNRGTEAFVIISGDDRMETVLGYSDNGAFVTENLPDNIREWLGAYAQAYRNIEKSATSAPVRRTATRSDFAASVAPLLGDIQYNQDAPYNNSCPTYGGQRCVTGCVATAAAQIMRYWKYPSVGTGNKSYTTQTHGLSCSYDFSTHPFDWDHMLTSYNGYDETEAELSAISNLMLACGMASEMDYDPYASGAYYLTMLNGFVKYLKYDENIYLTSRAFYTSDEWMELIKTELNENRPIFYTGSSTGGGHAFVVDGYDKNDKVHVNWGWSGYCNGYFEVLTLNANGGGIGGYDDNRYQFYQSMMVGLQPKRETTQYVSYFELSSLEIPTETVKTGNYFKAAVSGIYNMNYSSFSGRLGLVAEKDGVQTVLAYRTCDLDYTYGWNNLTLNPTIPTTLSDGTYEIYMASKAAHETRWNKAYSDLSESTTYTMVKQGNVCHFYSDSFDAEKDLSGSISLTHDLYQNLVAGIGITVRNNHATRDFFGHLGISIFNENLEPVQAMPCQQTLLKAGEEVQITVNNIITAEPGDYIIRITAGTTRYNYYIGQEEHITIKEASAGIPTLVIQNPRLECNELYAGDMLTLRATLSLSGNGSINSTWLYHTYSEAGESEPLFNELDRPYVDITGEVDYKYEIPIYERPGQYVYTLHSVHPVTERVKSVYSTTFIVLESSGVNDAKAEGQKPLVWYAQGENNLHIRTDAKLEDITIYSLAGQAIGQLRPTATGNGEYLVPAGDLDKGGYIMVLREKGGNRHTIKFIR